MMSLPQVSGALPTLGHVLEFRYRRLALLQRVAHECGDSGAFRSFRREVVVVNHPDDAAVVLGQLRAQSHRVARSLELYVGRQSVFTADEAAQHQAIRKHLVPLVQPHALHAQQVADQITAAVDALVASWHDGQTVDLAAAMQDLSLTILLRVVLQQGWGQHCRGPDHGAPGGLRGARPLNCHGA